MSSSSKKEQLLKQKGLEKATGALANAICYHSMYHTDACIKLVREVTKLMKKHKQDDLGTPEMGRWTVSKLSV